MNIVIQVTENEVAVKLPNMDKTLEVPIHKVPCQVLAEVSHQLKLSSLDKTSIFLSGVVDTGKTTRLASWINQIKVFGNVRPENYA